MALIHGLWGGPDDWNALQLDPSLFIEKLHYDDFVSDIAATSPQYPKSVVPAIKMNSMGFAYIAPVVLDQLRDLMKDFRQAYNIAAVQADVIGHSMGGDVSRTMVLLQSKFASGDTFGLGPIHKLITIATPHLGTPVANRFLDADDGCVRAAIAQWGDGPEIALGTVTFDDGTTVTGAVGDLETGSDALASLRPSGAEPFPTAHIAGIATPKILPPWTVLGFVFLPNSGFAPASMAPPVLQISSRRLDGQLCSQINQMTLSCLSVASLTAVALQ